MSRLFESKLNLNRYYSAYRNSFANNNEKQFETTDEIWQKDMSGEKLQCNENKYTKMLKK
jgi:hypothetical protein